MSNTLDYAPRRKPKPAFTRFTWAVLISVIEQLLVFALFAAALDGGRMAGICFGVSLGFWLVVLIIAIRRRRNPTQTDLAFIAFGYLAILIPCVIAIESGM